MCGPLSTSLPGGGNDDDDDDDDACLSKTRWKRRMRTKGGTGPMNRRKLAPPHKPIQRTAGDVGTLDTYPVKGGGRGVNEHCEEKDSHIR